MTKDEYYELLINADKPEYYRKFLDLDLEDEEEKRLYQEIKEDLPFNKFFIPVDTPVLKKMLCDIDNHALSIALKFANEQTKEKIFSCLPEDRRKEIERLFDLNGPQMFKVIIENQEKVLKGG